MSDKPIDYLINVGDGIRFLGDFETWKKAMPTELRWLRSETAGALTLRLQQLWQSSKGNVKWKDVPTVEVDSE